jgi:hypothetical protein
MAFGPCSIMRTCHSTSVLKANHSMRGSALYYPQWVEKRTLRRVR